MTKKNIKKTILQIALYAFAAFLLITAFAALLHIALNTPLSDWNMMSEKEIAVTFFKEWIHSMSILIKDGASTLIHHITEKDTQNIWSDSTNPWLYRH